MRWLREVKAIATEFDDLSSVPARDEVEMGKENTIACVPSPTK